MPDNTLNQQIERELAAFEALSTQANGAIEMARPFAHVLVLRPRANAVAVRAGTFGLTIMGITHGNEVAGLPIVNTFLREILADPARLRIPLALILGNPVAARQNRRFVDRDLNRSFSRVQKATWEDQRARDLEGILSQSSFLLDLHQTSEPSETPFFIFPYTANGYRFARAVAPRLPVVTHWGAPFSKDGQCTDEYVIACGGTGITLELGQNGMTREAIEAGTAAARAALDVATRKLAGEDFPQPADAPALYTWGEILPFPASGGNPLKPGWYNFKAVQKGDVLGNTPNGPLIASLAGRMLFPKYVRDAGAPRPAELCRILKPIREEELGRT